MRADVLSETVATLRAAGCVAAEEEAEELIAVAGARGGLLNELVERRCRGEPLAWLTGSVRFCGEPVHLRRGVYVPRWQSEPLALEAARRLPDHGVAVDLCTGSGAIARVLSRHRPRARVLATELDPVAAGCARENGVEVHEGDLDGPLPAELWAAVDVVCGVVPYVPTGALHLLARDVVAYEPTLALDGGPEGMDVLVRAVSGGSRLLRRGGSLLLELGAGQAELLAGELRRTGYSPAELLHDEEGDLRGIAAVFVAAPSRA